MRRIVFLALLLAVGSAQAQDHPAGLRGDVIMMLEDARTRTVSLLDAFSAEQLEWRPAEGVRSVQEVMVHVAATNFFFGTMLGVDMPDGIDPTEFEGTITTAEEILATVNASFDHIRRVVAELDLDELETPVQWFGGQERTRGFVLIVLPVHAHQHLGQLIAYARTIGVAPPWSL